jgi:SWI/SNF-related matrix-associated actin-dependent regulator of chromatin subfamily D
VWQNGDVGTDGASRTVNFDTGEGIPAWQLKIEGRLLEVRYFAYETVL